MANPLDMVTRGDGDQPIPRVYIDTSDAPVPDATGGGNALTQVTGASAASQQQWTMEDLQQGLAALADYVKNGQFSPGTKIGNRLFGTGGEERYQTWPEKMVRSALAAPGEAMASTEPITSEQMIAPAQDIAGMASGSTLFAKPGVGTLGSGPLRPGAKSAPTEPAPVFYSALEHATTNAAQDVMSPQQWLGYLKNQPGVKAEELVWAGLPEWLAGQKGKVKKEDVKAYLDEHKVEIKDVTKHGETDSEFADPNSQGDTKYSSYQLPGGENYREHLLTMPTKGKPVTEAHQQLLGEINRRYPETYYNIIEGKVSPDEIAGLERKGIATEEETADLIKAVASNKSMGQSYRSSHWDEPNVLAHVRTNDREFMPSQLEIGPFERSVEKHKATGVSPEMAERFARKEGLSPTGSRKSLHIEEIQSDWHQQGRKQGYKSDLAKMDEKPKTYDDIVVGDQITGWGKVQSIERGADGVPVFDMGGVKISPERFDISRVAPRSQTGLMAGPKGNAVPDAPFKTTWPELALKRMVRHAAENGYDRISWTPGEAQAARYDLSKSIDTLHAKKHADGTYALYGELPNGRDLHQFGQNVPADKLADYVGKDVAQKILDSKETKVELSGTDLKVGGEGMREFYDKMLPKMAEKIGKAHGVKVQKGTLPGDFVVKDKDGNVLAQADEAQIDFWLSTMVTAGAKKYTKERLAHDVHYFDLPQSLKDHAIGKGFPLYMSGVPFPLTPVDHDPFAKKGRK